MELGRVGWSWSKCKSAEWWSCGEHKYGWAWGREVKSYKAKEWRVERGAWSGESGDWGGGYGTQYVGRVYNVTLAMGLGKMSVHIARRSLHNHTEACSRTSNQVGHVNASVRVKVFDLPSSCPGQRTVGRLVSDSTLSSSCLSLEDQACGWGRPLDTTLDGAERCVHAIKRRVVNGIYNHSCGV
jgi:hypothetical protein